MENEKSPCPVCAGVQTLETSEGCIDCNDELRAAAAYARGGRTLEEAQLPPLNVVPFEDELGDDTLAAFAEQFGWGV